MTEPPRGELDHLVAARLVAVRQRIAAAGGTDVRVLPVTKTFPIEACWAAWRAGCTDVGENYAQEAVAKLGTAASIPFGVHFIGQLQSNKVRALAPLVSVYETVDRASLVRELALRAPGAPCTSGAQCTTGTCFGGICQGNVTCGTCYYSTNYNTSCSPYARGTYDSRCGGNGLVCTGSGSACLIASGYSCSLGGTPCLSGLCEYHFPSGFYCR